MNIINVANFWGDSPPLSTPLAGYRKYTVGMQPFGKLVTVGFITPRS